MHRGHLQQGAHVADPPPKALTKRVPKTPRAHKSWESIEFEIIVDRNVVAGSRQVSLVGLRVGRKRWFEARFALARQSAILPG
jgi:hypothetical protein